MAIREIGQSITQKLFNPAARSAQKAQKTAQNMGNPFSPSNFNGFILNSDVFAGSKVQSKAKLQMSSVLGTVADFGKKAWEPVSAFVAKVKERASMTWEKIERIANQDISEIGRKMADKVTNWVDTSSVKALKKQDVSTLDNMLAMELALI